VELHKTTTVGGRFWSEANRQSACGICCGMMKRKKEEEQAEQFKHCVDVFESSTCQVFRTLACKLTSGMETSAEAGNFDFLLCVGDFLECDRNLCSLSAIHKSIIVWKIVGCHAKKLRLITRLCYCHVFLGNSISFPARRSCHKTNLECKSYALYSHIWQSSEQEKRKCCGSEVKV
jgi:hypothetical protein